MSLFDLAKMAESQTFSDDFRRFGLGEESGEMLCSLNSPRFGKPWT
jgi:hypothetical protein